MTRSASAAMALGILCACATANGAVDFIPHVSVGYERNSNIFFVDEELRLDPSGTPRKADAYRVYAAGIDAEGQFSETKLTFTSSISKYQYDNFVQLDRSDKRASLLLNWVATRAVTGTTTLKYDQRQTPYNEIDSRIAEINFQDTEKSIANTVYYQMTSKASAELSAGYSQSTGPLTVGVNYDLRQTPWAAAFRYGRKSHLTVGVSVDGNTGKYRQDDTTPDTSTRQYLGLLTYMIGTGTSLDLAAGKTRFKQTGLSTDSGTGRAVFTQQLTAKTSYFLRYDQRVDLFPISAGRMESKTKSVGVSWRAANNIDVSASYATAHEDVFSGIDSGPTPVVGDTRNDKVDSYTAAVNYQFLKWLTLSPYFRHQDRESTAPGYNFDSNVYGATLTLRYR